MTETVRDPGLQPERTRLAWRRTTLSCTVAAVLAGKQALQGGPTPLGLLAVAASLALWLAFVALAHRRIRSLSVPRPGVLPVRVAWSAAGCVLAFTLFSAAVVR